MAQEERLDPIGNVYADAERAAAYATLRYPGTYYLAFRDIPALLERHARGVRALDFGCGAGRSSRFLATHGFTVTGVDISPQMIEQAQRADPDGDYRLIADGELAGMGSFDLIFAAFTFDNIAGTARREATLRSLAGLLAPGGRIVLLGSRPDIYWHEWASFSTAAFPANRRARSGEAVYIVMKDVPDARPVVDAIWFPEDYAALFEAAGLNVLETLGPLGLPSDGQEWISETTVAPWVSYALALAGTPRR
jgi:SAM-dependent methyltransferase